MNQEPQETKTWKSTTDFPLNFDYEGKEVNISPGRTFSGVENVYIRGLVHLEMLVEVAPKGSTKDSNKDASTPK